MAQILLIESDRQLAKNCQSYFKKAGHTVDIHADPQAAILKADAKTPDIVMVDFMLAGRSGMEFLYELRSYPEWQDIPVVVIGSYPAEQVSDFSQIFEELNVKTYLHKPTTSLESTLEEIESLLQPVR